MDLLYPPRSQNSVCASLNPLKVVNLTLILGILHPGVADPLLIVSMFTAKHHRDLA